VKYGYDNDGNLTSVTDAAGNVTRRFAYTDGLMVSHINALGFECRYGSGHVLSALRSTLAR
jgi:hypothetical protein